MREMVPEVGEVDQFAHIAVVLRGPKGQGKLILVASAVAELWSFHRLFVSIEGREAPISLLADE
jgi:hypothetical protein